MQCLSPSADAFYVEYDRCTPACCTRCSAYMSQRLPPNFEPLFAFDKDNSGRQLGTQEGHGRSEPTTTRDDAETETSSRASAVGHVPDWMFRLLFTVTSSRNWDRLYLLLGLFWAVLWPGYMDGVTPVGRTPLASLLFAMFALALMPAISAVVLKALFLPKLRISLQERKHSAVRIPSFRNLPKAPRPRVVTVTIRCTKQAFTSSSYLRALCCRP